MPTFRPASGGRRALILLTVLGAAACAPERVEPAPVTGTSSNNPLPSDSVFGTPPDPIPADQPPPGLRFTPPAQLTAWRQLRDQNHVLWQTAVSVCSRTGAANERYGDTGEWCAIVAATNDDPIAAGKAITKLRSIVPDASDNDRREGHISRLIMRDLLARWMTPADEAVVDAALTRWTEIALAINTAQYQGGMRIGDSDLTTGTACGVLLHDLYFGTNYRSNAQYTVGINALTSYVQMAQGGEWIESSEYNPGTVVLLAMCNMAVRTATGGDVVPGTSQFLVDAGRLGAYQVTPDLIQAIQWGDEENARQFLYRLYRRATYLAAMPNGEAQWTFDQLVSRHWQFGSEQLMARALLLAQPNIPRVPVSDRSVASPALGTLYTRVGTALGFATALLNTGVDHTGDFPSFDAQIYRDGEWALTHPIGYGAPDEFTVNGALYAGLANFAQRTPTWHASGAGWGAMAGVVSGQYQITSYPRPPEFLRYGGRVTVVAHDPNYSIVIVRDSVDMSDPRAASNWPTGWRNTSQYPHQQRIEAHEGKFWAMWHAPVAPTVNGNTIQWQTPGGQTARVEAFATQPIQVVVVNEATLGWNGLDATEIKWHARIHSPAPVLWQVFVVGRGTLPTVSQSGNTITVGPRSWTITSAGVTGP